MEGNIGTQTSSSIWDDVLDAGISEIHTEHEDYAVI